MSQSLAWPTKFHGSPKLHQPPKALSLLLRFSQLPSASSRPPSAPLPGPCKLSWFPGLPEVPQSHFWVPEIPLGSLSLALGLPRSFGPQNWPETPIPLSPSPNAPLPPQSTAGGCGLNRHSLRGPRPDPAPRSPGPPARPAGSAAACRRPRPRARGPACSAGGPWRPLGAADPQLPRLPGLPPSRRRPRRASAAALSPRAAAAAELLSDRFRVRPHEPLTRADPGWGGAGAPSRSPGYPRPLCPVQAAEQHSGETRDSLRDLPLGSELGLSEPASLSVK